MRRYLIIAMLGLVLAPHAAVAQQSPAARIEAAKRRAADAGIPISLLESRVAEGRAKGIPMERIAVAVERRAKSLDEARRAMAGARGLTGADLSSGADAVEAGIDVRALRSLVADARAEDRPVAIAVLTYLHRERGLPVDQALARVREAMGKGSEALRTLPAQAAAGARRTGRPEGVGNPAAGGAAGRGGGPPGALPTPGQKPGAGRPDGVGKGKPGGKPGGGQPGGGG